MILSPEDFREKYEIPKGPIEEEMFLVEKQMNESAQALLKNQPIIVLLNDKRNEDEVAQLLQQKGWYTKVEKAGVRIQWPQVQTIR